jgi:hypothetical protein
MENDVRVEGIEEFLNLESVGRVVKIISIKKTDNLAFRRKPTQITVHSEGH